MRVKLSTDVDAAYIYLTDIPSGGVKRTVEAVEGEIMLDFDAEGVLLGIEVLGASKVLPPDLIKEAGK